MAAQGVSPEFNYSERVAEFRELHKLVAGAASITTDADGSLKFTFPHRAAQYHPKGDQRPSAVAWLKPDGAFTYFCHGTSCADNPAALHNYFNLCANGHAFKLLKGFKVGTPLKKVAKKGAAKVVEETLAKFCEAPDVGELARPKAPNVPDFALTHAHELRAPSGGLLAVKWRFEGAVDPATGKRAKTFRSAWFDGAAWTAQGGNLSRLLYGLDRLAKRSDAPALLVEGEKVCDALVADPRFAHLVPVSVVGGHDSLTLEAASFLVESAREVIFWNDAEPGWLETARKWAGALTLAGASRRRLWVVGLPDELVKLTSPQGHLLKWDPADAEVSPWTLEALFARRVLVEQLFVSADRDYVDVIKDAPDLFNQFYVLVRSSVSQHPGAIDVSRQAQPFLTQEQFNAKFNPFTKPKTLGAAWSYFSEGAKTHGRVLEGEVFKPGEELIVSATKELGGLALNRYRPPIIVPVAYDETPSFVEVFLAHLIWGLGPREATYVLNWLAHMFQKPHEVPSVLICLHGVEGSGKSVIANIISKLWGNEMVLGDVAPEQLLEKFNAFVRNKMFACINELDEAGAAALVKIAHKYVAKPDGQIGLRDMNELTEQGVIHMRLLTIANTYLPEVPPDDRRVFLAKFLPSKDEIAAKKASDPEYFTRLYEPTPEALGQLLYYLTSVHKLPADWSAYDEAPMTELKRDAQIRYDTSKQVSWRTRLRELVEQRAGPFRQGTGAFQELFVMELRALGAFPPVAQLERKKDESDEDYYTREGKSLGAYAKQVYDYLKQLKFSVERIRVTDPKPTPINFEGVAIRRIESLVIWGNVKDLTGADIFRQILEETKETKQQTSAAYRLRIEYAEPHQPEL